MAAEALELLQDPCLTHKKLEEVIRRDPAMTSRLLHIANSPFYASRMESKGETGKINVSGSTFELIKDEFNCIHRGKIEAKNKGMIDMYFVEKTSP